MLSFLRYKFLYAGLFVILLIALANFWLFQNPSQTIPSDINKVEDITFFALGDAGKGNFAQWRVASGMESVADELSRLDFVAVLGDNFYTSKDLSLKSKVWNAYFENVYSGRFLSAVPFYAVLGNHDSNKKIKDEIAYSQQHQGSNRWRMPAKFYARDMGNIAGRPLLRIVFIDSQPNVSSLKIQADFIRKSFASANKPVWRIVVGHHPVRNYGKHADETGLMQQYILPALKAAKVDTYISGHDHNQQTIVSPNEPVYFIAGSGGAGLYDIKYRDKRLVYGESVHGFLSVNLNKTNMQILQHSANGAVLNSYQLQQECGAQATPCLSVNKPTGNHLANFAE